MTGDSAGPSVPTASRLLPVLVIVPLVALIIRRGRPHYLETDVAAVGVALVCAVIFGLPALFWALDHRRTRLGPLLALGTAAGLLSPVAIFAVGIVGQLQYGGAAYLRRVIDHGATLPWYGMLRWHLFAGLAVASAIAGGTSGVVYWLLFVHRPRSIGVAVLLSLGVIAAAVGVTILLP